MENSNYYCKIIIPSKPSITEVMLTYEVLELYKKMDCAYKGELKSKDKKEFLGYFYLASHPGTKEMIMRYDFIQVNRNKKYIDEIMENKKWDEIKTL